MKITQVISDTNVGGAGVLISSVIGSLKNDFDFEVIIPKGSALKERLPSDVNVTELKIKGDRSFYPTDVSDFYKFFKKQMPDVIHTHAQLSSRIGGKMAGVKACISTRHCAHGENNTSKRPLLQRGVYNYCTDITISTADCVAKELVCEGVDISKIRTIKNGSPRLSPASDDEKRKIFRELGLPKEARIIGSCARLESIKGQDLLLRIAPRLLSLFPDVYLLFVGDGSMKERYQKITSLLGICSRVRFVGYTPEPERYQKLFYINVNSSRGTETSCLATSECMSIGIPTVASDFGGNREMIENGKNGLIFKCDNAFDLERALILLLSSSALYKRLSASAMESYAQIYSIEKMAGEYKKLYESLAHVRTTHF